MKYRTDPNLLSEVRKYGRFDTNACYQCGSCTISCNLIQDSISFPRKIIRYAILGLRDLLNNSIEPWICHDCGDCSITCPRQADPRESMATLRRYLSSQYDWTGLASKINSSKAWYMGSIIFVFLLVPLLVAFYHLYISGMEYSDFITMPMGLEHMFGLIQDFTLVVILIPFIFLLSNAFRMYWLAMHKGNKIKIPFFLYVIEARVYITHTVTHKWFEKCPEKKRWPKHWMLAFGCVLMLVILVFFLNWFQTDNIYPIYHPQRWLGYLATIFLVYGSIDILIGRIRKKKEIHKFSEFGDYAFPTLLLLIALSGIAVHIFRYMGLELTTHFTYAIHIAITVPMLIIEIPFGKMSHMIYRPLAIYFLSVKEKALQMQTNKEPVLENV
jgi:ferredoxin-like protein FixX